MVIESLRDNYQHEFMSLLTILSLQLLVSSEYAIDFRVLVVN